MLSCFRFRRHREEPVDFERTFDHLARAVMLNGLYNNDPALQPQSKRKAAVTNTSTSVDQDACLEGVTPPAPPSPSDFKGRSAQGASGSGDASPGTGSQALKLCAKLTHRTLAFRTAKVVPVSQPPPLASVTASSAPAALGAGKKEREGKAGDAAPVPPTLTLAAALKEGVKGDHSGDKSSPPHPRKSCQFQAGEGSARGSAAHRLRRGSFLTAAKSSERLAGLSGREPGPGGAATAVPGPTPRGASRGPLDSILSAAGSSRGGGAALDKTTMIRALHAVSLRSRP